MPLVISRLERSHVPSNPGQLLEENLLLKQVHEVSCALPLFVSHVGFVRKDWPQIVRRTARPTEPCDGRFGERLLELGRAPGALLDRDMRRIERRDGAIVGPTQHSSHRSHGRLKDGRPWQALCAQQAKGSG